MTLAHVCSLQHHPQLSRTPFYTPQFSNKHFYVLKIWCVTFTAFYLLNRNGINIQCQIWISDNEFDDSILNVYCSNVKPHFVVISMLNTREFIKDTRHKYLKCQYLNTKDVLPWYFRWWIIPLLIFDVEHQVVRNDAKKSRFPQLYGSTTHRGSGHQTEISNDNSVARRSTHGDQIFREAQLWY